MGGVVYAVTSGKGGVGKTTTAVSLGVALHDRGYSVVVLDADIGMPNVAYTLDVEPDVTLHDLLADVDDTDDTDDADDTEDTIDTDDAIREEATAGDAAAATRAVDGRAVDGRAVDERAVAGAVVELAEGIDVLAGDPTLEGYAAAAPTGLETVVDALADRYDCVLLDTDGGVSYEGVLPLELCDAAVLVTSPDPAAVGDTAKSKELAGRLDAPVAGVVVTSVTDGDDPGELAGRLGVDLLGAIPLDPAVTESATAGVPLATHDPACEAAVAYDQVAEGLSSTIQGSTQPTDGAARSTASGGSIGAPDGEGVETAGSSGSLDSVAGPGTGSVDGGDGSVVADGDGEAWSAGGVLSRLSGLLR